MSRREAQLQLAAARAALDRKIRKLERAKAKGKSVDLRQLSEIHGREREAAMRLGAKDSGMVLGGWNELRACRDLDIEPKFEKFSDGGPLGFVLRENLTGPKVNELQQILFVDKHSVWSTYGGNRKPNARVSRVLGLLEQYVPGETLGGVVPVPFWKVKRLHSLRSRLLKDDNGEEIEGTIAWMAEEEWRLRHDR
jgi:hypothetical protein